MAGATSAGAPRHSPNTGSPPEYQAIRDELALPLLWIVDRIASNDWDEAEISELLLQLGAAMARDVDAVTSTGTGTCRDHGR